jgi:uncharacterized protein YndB with AHSA1/START domain
LSAGSEKANHQQKERIAMETTIVKAPALVEVKRVFQAPLALVYQAWTDPKMMNAWYHPNHEMTSVCTTAVRAGGRYEVQMHPKEGKPYIVAGRYQEVIPGEKLVFTWRWQHDEGEEPNEETLVTVQFRTIDTAQTEITLRHERFGSDEERDGHAWGWQETFDRLSETL